MPPSFTMRKTVNKKGLASPHRGTKEIAERPVHSRPPVSGNRPGIMSPGEKLPSHMVHLKKSSKLSSNGS